MDGDRLVDGLFFKKINNKIDMLGFDDGAQQKISGKGSKIGYLMRDNKVKFNFVSDHGCGGLGSVESNCGRKSRLVSGTANSPNK